MRGRMTIIRTGQFLAQRGLAPGSSGNLSLKGEGARFLITRIGAPLGSLTVDDIIEMDTEGQVVGAGEPSSEWRLHAAIYRETIHRAVLHCHPAALIAVTTIGHSWIPPTRELQADFQELKIVDHPGPNMLDPGPAVEILQNDRAVMLRAHGLVLAGPELPKLAHLAETFEDAARISLWLKRGMTA